MKGNRAVLTAAVVVAVVIVGWFLFRGGSGAGSVDLIGRFDTAGKRPSPEAFTLGDVTLNGDTKRAISVRPGAGSRLIFKLAVPDDGWLKVDVGLKPEAWTQEGNGVLFMAGVSDGRAFEQLFTQHVNPFGHEADRRWIPVMVDLSTYAGEEVEIILNTFAGPEGQAHDDRADLAVWGQPEIVVR